MTEVRPTEKSWITILFLMLGVLGLLLYLTQALTMGVMSLMAYFGEQANTASAVSNSLLAWSSLFTGLLFIPVVILSIKKLRGQPEPEWLDETRPFYKKAFLALLIIWPVVILLGMWISGEALLSVFVLGLFNILVAGVPVLAIYTLSRQKLQSGPSARKWRLFSFSLGFTPWAVILVEVIALLGVFLVAALLVAFQITFHPALEFELQAIFSDISTGMSLEMILQQYGDLINQPIVIFGLVAIIAGIMPLIEEILKPLALWMLAGRGLTDQEGFVAGLITGAAFTLMENLLYFSMAYTSEEWVFSALLRSTTGVLHMLGSGLVGLGLARTWRKGDWPFLAITFSGAVLFHSAWNAIALVASGAPILLFGAEPTFWEQFVFMLPLFFLLIAAVITMILINRKLRKEQDPTTTKSSQMDTGQEQQQIMGT
ncbi:MAG: PrsW family glutamic-type intramembrane protease [Chloroflexota bacterium]|nr:PrsW family glutamic-type intramembrane protease [Chloroflexota bacterium]